MQLILFVELCSEMSSRMIFWPNKSICTLIWIPSKYTQMSVKPNHYLEPCHIYQSGGSHGIFLKAQVSCYALRCKISASMTYFGVGGALKTVMIIFCHKKQLKMAIFDPFHQLRMKKIPL